MRVAIYRFYRNGTVARNPVAVIDAKNVDDAIRIFPESPLRKKLPEQWNFAYEESPAAKMVAKLLQTS